MTVHLRRAKRSFIRIMPGLAALALALFAMPGTAGNTRELPDIRILWTNDTHGYLTPNFHREEGDDNYMQRAKHDGREGGFAYLATLIKRQRAVWQGRTLVLDAGDTWHGTVVPLRLDGRPVLDVMNAIGYDAMVPGNVEFMFGKEILTNLIGLAKFPIIAANWYDAEWDERVQIPNVYPYVVRTVGRTKVAIVGMTYHWTSKTIAATDIEGWSFGLRIDELQQDIDRLRNTEKVDLVVVLSHMGWSAEMKYATLVSGIDVVVGAHTHDILYRPSIVSNEKGRRDVLIVQSGSHGKLLGQLDLKVRDGRVVAFEQTLFPVRSRDIAPDRKVAAMIEKARAPYKAELERVIGHTDTLIYRQAEWQSPADNLVTDAIRARSRRQLAFSAPWRFGATILPGPITVEDVYNLVPVETPMRFVRLPGKALREIMEASVDNVAAQDPFDQVGANLLRFSGMELVLDLRQPFPRRIQRIAVNGQPLQDDRYYTIADINTSISDHPTAVDLRVTNRIGPVELIGYIKGKQVLAPRPDRRVMDTTGRILSDHLHLHERWQRSGRSEVDPNDTGPFRYHGCLGSDGRLSFITP